METQTQQNGTAPAVGGVTGTALALRGPSEASAYEPRDINEARALAKSFSDSKLTKCRTPEQALLVMATGRELGIPATAALRMIYVADFGQGDQVALSADLMVALCLRSPLCEYFRCTESTDERATYVTRRRNEPERSITFTNEDRVKAKLGFSKAKENKPAEESPDSNWAKYRRTMLQHRAASLLAREVYPDILGGFYTDEEMRDMAALNNARDVTPLPASPAAVATRSVAPAKPVDAEMVDSNEERIVKLLEAAATDKEVAAGAAEALKAWPQVRPERVKRAHLDAKARLKAGQQQAAPAPEAAPAEPAHDERTGEVREPGQDDA